jgi:biphenyl 2,3-dioxygenase beta subunit
MTVMPDGGGSSANISNLELGEMHRQYKVEKFYYEEAAMLDARNYDEWLTVFSPDVHYFMPIRRTMTSNELDQEFTRPGDLALFDDDFNMLSARVRKLATGYSWAEDPPSRQRHIVSNVRVVSDDGDQLKVESNFHFYRTRLNSEEDTWIGSRHDLLRREGDTFKVAKREIFLEQTVLLARNLSNFF